MKILSVVNPQTTALQYHRQIVPHHYLINVSDISADKCPHTIDNMTDETLKEYQIVTYLRQVRPDGKTEQEIIRARKLGLKVIVDIDDYWETPPTHHLFNEMKKNKFAESTITGLKMADWVTTTTSHFASIIYQYNENITVLPNCISPIEKQFIPSTVENNKVRMGWIGGVYHKDDFLEMDKGIRKLLSNENLKDKYQLCLGGYTKNSEYDFFEKVLTNNYLSCDSDYTNYLKQYTPLMEHYSFNKPYRRLWAKSIEQYATLYNDIDVALVPLKENKFNSCKSELKIVEAGHFSKAVICSNVLPYKPFLKHRVNCLVCEKEKDWYYNIKTLIENPEMKKDLGAAMKETINEHFNIHKHTQTRYELYKYLASQ